MPQNDFLPFATAPDANVSPQSEYAALALLRTGFSSGVARSLQMNKVWRQSSIMSAVLAAFIVDQSGQAAIDDGTTATLKANLLAAINGAVSNAFASKIGLQQDLYTSAIATGTADAIVAAFSPAITSTTLASATTTLTVRATAANVTTAPTFTPNSGVVAVASIVKGANQALVAGDIAGAGHWITLQWDATLSKWVLLNPAKGVTIAQAGALSGGYGITASGAIPLSQMNGFFEITTAGITITLPAAGTVPSGSTLTLWNLSSGAVTLAGGINSGIGSTSTSISMPVGQTGIFVFDGTSWSAMGGSMVCGPSYLKSSPGYFQLPNGWIVQMGQCPSSIGVTVTLPVTFPNAFISLATSVISSGTSVARSSIINTSSFTWNPANAAGAGYYIAVGY